MDRYVYCEFCDYRLSGLLEPGLTAVCPECGKQATGRWLPRRVRVSLAVVVALAPIMAWLVMLFIRPGFTIFSFWPGGIQAAITGAIGFAGVALPPVAAWWLWSKSGRSKVDFVDIACLVPVAWVLNGVAIYSAARLL